MDVVIVGAGVAGCAAALHLAASGRDVVLLDRGSWPREKVCGEGLMPHGVAELERLGLAAALRRTGARPFSGIAWHLDGERAVGRFPAPRSEGLGVRRVHLDRILAQACAREARIDLRSQVVVRDVAVDRGGVTVRTADGTLRAETVIGADGRHSRVRRALGLGLGSRRPPRYGIRAHYRVVEPPPDVVEVHVTPDCELYVTPTGTHELNVAVLCGRDLTRRLKRDLEQGFEQVIARCTPVADRLRGAERLTAPRLCGPLRQEVSGVTSERALLVGDAAGFVDAITGEGMSIAMVSARLAAETVADGLDLAGYARAHRRAIRDATWLTELVLWGLRKPWLARRVVRNLGRHPDLFGRLLAVNTGERAWSALGPAGVARLVTG